MTSSSSRCGTQAARFGVSSERFAPANARRMTTVHRVIAGSEVIMNAGSKFLALVGVLFSLLVVYRVAPDELLTLAVTLLVVLFTLCRPNRR